MNKSTRQLLETFIVSTSELSTLTGIPMITIQKWVERGQVDCVKKGRTYLFDCRDFAGQIEIPAVGPEWTGPRPQAQEAKE